jgi:hypothetical protein
MSLRFPRRYRPPRSVTVDPFAGMLMTWYLRPVGSTAGNLEDEPVTRILVVMPARLA